jgi:hypothetical protein
MFALSFAWPKLALLQIIPFLGHVWNTNRKIPVDLSFLSQRDSSVSLDTIDTKYYCLVYISLLISISVGAFP